MITGEIANTYSAYDLMDSALVIFNNKVKEKKWELTNPENPKDTGKTTSTSEDRFLALSIEIKEMIKTVQHDMKHGNNSSNNRGRYDPNTEENMWR